MSVLGKRWTGLIVRALLERSCRFAELASAVEGLSDRMLSERLKELEAEGIVQRRVIPDMPVRVEYSLTEKGRDLQRVVGEIHRWGERWSAPAPLAASEPTAP
jgi:DNA-binding HxlR family transcriptional regulator